MNYTSKEHSGSGILEVQLSEEAEYVIKLFLLPVKDPKILLTNTGRLQRSFEKMTELNQIPSRNLNQIQYDPDGFPLGSVMVAAYHISGEREMVNIVRMDKLLSTFFDAFPNLQYQIEPINKS